jgi:hypothetical protein
LLNAPAQAESQGFPQLFAKALGISEPIKAERSGQTITSPYGGSYTIDYGNWSGNSGTVTVTYNNFVLPYVGWIYNGTWTYTGSVLNNGYLEGTLVGSWSISGLNLGYAGVSDPSYGFNMTFHNGYATGTMNFTMTLYGQPYSQSMSLSFNQADFVGYLL